MVSAGSIVTYQCQATNSSFTEDNDQVEAQIAAILGAEGVIVENYTITNESIGANVLADLTFTPRDFSLTLTVQVQSGYSSPDDIKSVIDNAVYQATGSLPNSSTVPFVQDPSASSPTATGAASQSQASSASSGGIAGVFQGLETQGALGLGLVGLGIIVALVLITSPGRASAAL